MKSILFILFLSTTIPISALAQMSSPIRVKAGEDLYEKLAKEIYLYPEFTSGTVMFRDGQVNQSNFNYNMLNGEIQFIDSRGDTLSLANELTIKYVAIAKDSFYYHLGYLKLVAGNEIAKFVKKQKIKIIDQQKIGAYDQPSSAGSITSYSSMSNDLKSFRLNIRQDVIMAKETSFYVGDKYNNFSRATRKNIVKMFSKKENQLNDYFKNNNVDLNKEEDLAKLVAVLKD